MPIQPAIFETHEIRRIYDEDTETWWFSVVDIIQALTQQSDYQAARNYWKVLKNRLTKEGSESVTNCNRLKLPAADGKNYLTDVATAETLLRLVQSVPSPKAELIFTALAELSTRQIAETDDATGMAENKAAATQDGATGAVRRQLSAARQEISSQDSQENREVEIFRGRAPWNHASA